MTWKRYVFMLIYLDPTGCITILQAGYFVFIFNNDLLFLSVCTIKVCKIKVVSSLCQHQEIRALERYIRRLEFQISKVTQTLVNFGLVKLHSTNIRDRNM